MSGRTKQMVDYGAFYNSQVQLQLQEDKLKSDLELKTIKADSNIKYLRSQLNKSKQLVEQFQEAVDQAKDKGKEEFCKNYDKLKMTIEKDTETKVVQLLLDKLSCRIEEFEEKLRKMYPNYEVSCYSLLI